MWKVIAAADSTVTGFDWDEERREKTTSALWDQGGNDRKNINNNIVGNNVDSTTIGNCSEGCRSARDHCIQDCSISESIYSLKECSG